MARFLRRQVALAVCVLGIHGGPSKAAGDAPTAPPSLPADPVGRLFLAPADRAALDRARVRGERERPAAAAGTVTLNGIVRRSGGPSTVWVNQVPRSGPDRSDRGDGRRTEIELGESQRITLQVGEIVDITTMARSSAVGAGMIRVPGSPPAAKTPAPSTPRRPVR